MHYWLYSYMCFLMCMCSLPYYSVLSINSRNVLCKALHIEKLVCTNEVMRLTLLFQPKTNSLNPTIHASTETHKTVQKFMSHQYLCTLVVVDNN